MYQGSDIRHAVEVLRAGGLVAFPTETVYGLGADAENATAVAQIFAAKGRPLGHPLIVHLGEVASLAAWARHVPHLASRLAEHFSPGPLTLILHRQARIPDIVTGGLETVGLRVPSHPTASALLRAFGGGVAAPQPIVLVASAPRQQRTSVKNSAPRYSTSSLADSAMWALNPPSSTSHQQHPLSCGRRDHPRGAARSAGAAHPRAHGGRCTQSRTVGLALCATGACGADFSTHTSRTGNSLTGRGPACSSAHTSRAARCAGRCDDFRAV